MITEAAIEKLKEWLSADDVREILHYAAIGKKYTESGFYQVAKNNPKIADAIETMLIEAQRRKLQLVAIETAPPVDWRFGITFIFLVVGAIDSDYKPTGEEKELAKKIVEEYVNSLDR